LCIIEHFGNADAVPQPPKRCLSRKAGIVRCCLNILLVSLQQILRVFCPPFLRPGQKMRFFYFMALLYGQIIVK